MVDTTKLHPELVKRLTRVLDAMAAFGEPMRICQGVRTADEQAKLFAQGRTVPGKVVTNCDGVVKKSNHQAKDDGFGYAVDCCFTAGEPFGDKRPWAAFGALAVAAGLKWGGNWTGTLVDRPHIEITKP